MLCHHTNFLYKYSDTHEIIIIIITFMQGIYNYIPGINHVFLGVQFCSCSVFTIYASCNVISLVKYALYFYISTFRSMCAVPSMAVVCISLILCFPSMFLIIIIIIIIKLVCIRLFGLLKVTINFLEVATNIGETLQNLFR